MMNEVESRVVLTCSSLLATVQSLSTAWRSRACAMAEGAAATETEREYQDCLACRVTGSATLLGVSAYFFHERGKLPKHDVGQRRWLLACCGAFAIAGVWRATTSRFATAVDSDDKETKQ